MDAAQDLLDVGIEFVDAPVAAVPVAVGGPARAACPRTRFRSILGTWIVPASPSRRVRPPNGR